MKCKRTRNESPKRQALRELIGSYMKERPVKDGEDGNAMMRGMMPVVLEEALDGELNEELGYSMYDHKNKDTKTSATDTAKRLCTQAMAIWNSIFCETETVSLSSK